MDLINNYRKFIDFSEGFKSNEKNLIIELIYEYYLEEKQTISLSILKKIERIIFNDDENYIGKLFSPSNKYVLGSVLSDLNFIKKDLWILLSVISRLKILKRQKIVKSKSHKLKYNINELKNQINEDGIISINNYLDNNIHSKIMEELLNQPLALNKKKFANVKYSLPFLRNANVFPRRLKFSSKVIPPLAFLSYELGFVDSFWQSKKLLSDTTFCQKIFINSKEEDLQKDAHMDTYFPSLKFWYFPFDVNVNKAFKFSFGSNKYTLPRMKFESKKIYDISTTNQNSDPNKKINTSKHSDLQGSLRYSENDLKDLELTLEPFPVKANTLVLADVSGVHSRGIGESSDDKALRVALHGNLRHLNIF